MNYDILFSIACYHSSRHTINFIKSTKHLCCTNLTVVTCAREEDAQKVLEGLEDCASAYKVFVSSVNNSYFCKNWGFLYAWQNNLNPRWYCNGDDDTEFYSVAKDIMARLEEAHSIGFSLLAFRNPNQTYGAEGMDVRNGFRTDLRWIDGNMMFSRYSDNIWYGLPDSIREEPITFFVEAEYCNRMKILAGKPLLADITKDYYIHHFRNDPQLRIDRNPNDVQGMTGGSNLFIKKYGVQLVDWNRPDNHKIIWDAMSNPDNQEKLRHHILYDGLWNDWDKIVEFSAQYIHEARRNDVQRIESTD